MPSAPDAPRLTRQLLSSRASDSRNPVPDDLDLPGYAPPPARILQFGEGNFLRGFVDWMIDAMNRAGAFNGGVVVVQPRAGGHVKKLAEQDGLYTVLLRGNSGGEVVNSRRVIGCISASVNPYRDYDALLKFARDPAIRFVVSNTTEAGIVFDPSDRADDRPPLSFPGKLAAVLVERWQASQSDDRVRGLVILPCELIDRNGDRLRECVMQVLRGWNVSQECVDWIERENVFANTLVDRIVSGFPADEAGSLRAELGYDDANLLVSEPYHAWVIEAPAALKEELSFDRAGLNVTWTDDVSPYRERKVRILNGGHTMIALASYLAGLEAVGDCMKHAVVSRFLREGIEREIIPGLDQPREELRKFADDVFERFANPFLQHQLSSIALNSTSKVRSRLLPSLRDFAKREGRLPNRLTLALAALIVFHSGKREDGSAFIVNDDAIALELFSGWWTRVERNEMTIEQLCASVAESRELWGDDLAGVTNIAAALAQAARAILDRGVLAAMEEACHPREDRATE